MRQARRESSTAALGGRRELFHVAVLMSLAVATPLTELLRGFPEFLWTHGLELHQVFGLVVGLLVLAPLPFIGLVVVGRWVPSLGRLLTGVAVAGPLCMIGSQVAVRLGMTGWVAVGLALVGATSGALAYLYLRPVKRFVSLLAIVGLVAPLRLLLAPGVEAMAAAPEGLDLGHTGSRAPIVFVVFDELPMVSLLGAGEAWDAENFPNFARLAGVSHAFLNAHSAHAATLRAVPAIVAGRPAIPNRAATVANYPRNLFTLFGGDHQLWAVESATHLCPSSLNRMGEEGKESPGLISDLSLLWLTLSIPQPWASDLPPVDMAWTGFGAEAAAQADEAEETAVEPSDAAEFDLEYRQARARIRQTRAVRDKEFRRFIDTLGQSGQGGQEDRPSLHFIHTMLPHAPFIFTPTGSLYDTGERARPGGWGTVWSSDEEIVALGYQRHLLQARFADRLLGELLDHLVEASTFDSSMIVVTADHGASFRSGQIFRDSGGANPDETLWVPLLIKQPGQSRGEKHRHRVEATAILPTMLDLLDVASPWPFATPSAMAEGGSADNTPPVASAARAWKTRLFGSPPSFEPPLRLNRHFDLVGRNVEEFEVRRTKKLEVRRLEPGETLQYDPAAALLPTWVTGRLVDRREGGECCDLAFVIEGRIVAVQHTYAGGSVAERFQVLLPEESLRAGANGLRVLVIEGSGAERHLLAPRIRRRG